MDEAQATKLAEEMATRGPVGGRGGLGFEAGTSKQDRGKLSAAEKELLGASSRKGGLASMQATVARAITHGHADFDPWRKPVKSADLNKVNGSKVGLYGHFQSGGLLSGNPAANSDRDGRGHGGPSARGQATGDISRKEVRKALKSVLRASAGSAPDGRTVLKAKKLRKAVIARVAGEAAGKSKRRAARQVFAEVLAAGAEKGLWQMDDGVVIPVPAKP